MNAEPAVWSRRLRQIAWPVLAGTPLTDPAPQPSTSEAYIQTFSDGAGFRRPSDRPMLAWMLAVHPGLRPGRLTPQAAAWWRLHISSPNDPAWGLGTDGPLVPELRNGAIETWTEAELSVLHALWWTCTITKDAIVAARLRHAASWMLRELQPDNGTLRPWAVHVFVRLAADPGFGDPQASLHYADTLVHNCLAAGQAIDPLTACILLDAARELDGWMPATITRAAADG